MTDLVPSYKTPHGVLYVMRHGKTVLDNEKRSDGWLDYPLSDEGRIGIMPSQQFLKQAPIDCVVTCGLRRCEETAHIMASGILNHPTKEINEDSRTWNLGTLIGSRKKPNKPVVKYFMHHPDEVPESGESMNSFRKRFMGVVKDLLKRVRRGENILLVCSGSGIREISRMLAGDTESFDLTESGLLMITPYGKSLQAKVIFGHKNDKTDYWMS
jgi:broad specificity phosphatase PhoE